jgi:PTH1 family peptidyl-tRNA hydrolase
VHLIVGLGNPGAKYADNRHNIGFMILDRFGATHGAPAFRERFQGLFTKLQVHGQDVGLLKPTTYMNLSGRSVALAMRFFKLSQAELTVAHDELDLALRTLRIKQGGGTAGHRGLASIVECCGGPDYARLRVGIGRPQSGSVEHFVLSDFSAEEGASLPDVLERATSALTDIVARGTQAAMNAHNQKGSVPSS